MGNSGQPSGFFPRWLPFFIACSWFPPGVTILLNFCKFMTISSNFFPLLSHQNLGWAEKLESSKNIWTIFRRPGDTQSSEGKVLSNLPSRFLFCQSRRSQRINPHQEADKHWAVSCTDSLTDEWEKMNEWTVTNITLSRRFTSHKFMPSGELSCTVLSELKVKIKVLQFYLSLVIFNP